MGHYCSIKGWLETSFDVLPALQQQIQTYWLDATVTEPTLERREMYFQAWRFAQQHSSNWSAYTFLGLDFQQQYLDWLKTGMALEMMLLYATSEKISASYLNQPLEVKNLVQKIRESLNMSGYPQQIIRLGYGQDVKPTPRRNVNDVIR